MGNWTGLHNPLADAIEETTKEIRQAYEGDGNALYAVVTGRMRTLIGQMAVSEEFDEMQKARLHELASLLYDM